MARTTAEQRDARAILEAHYGPADREMLESTDEPYGLLWLRWHEASVFDQFPDRNLFIRPDGSRLSWRMMH